MKKHLSHFICCLLTSCIMLSETCTQAATYQSEAQNISAQAETSTTVSTFDDFFKALGKYKRSVGHFTNVDPIDNIVEEMTHVAISSEIVARILNINPEDIQREVNKKAVKYNLSKGDGISNEK